MGMNFPDPLVAQEYLAPNGSVYYWRTNHWARYGGTALPENLLVNPSMQVSQQNGGNQSPTTSATADYYMADQWSGRWSLDGGTITAGRYSAPLASMGFYSAYVNCVAAQASLSTHSYALITQNIEGNRLVGLGWGTADAKNVVLRFTVSTTVGGTFSVRLSNGNVTRSYVSTFTVASGVWTDIVLPIPGDKTGTWVTDHTLGLRVDFVYAIGSNYTAAAGTENTWQDGDKYAVPGQTNGVATASTSFHIGGVGLYVDPYKTGLAPEFQGNAFEDDLQDCMRYWYRLFGTRGFVVNASQIVSAAVHYVPMRVVPSYSLFGGVQGYDLYTAPALTAVSPYQGDHMYTSLVLTASGFGVPRAGGTIAQGMMDRYIIVNARM